MDSPSSSSLYITAATLSLLYYTALILYWHRRSKSSTSTPLPPGPSGLPLVGNLPFIEPELHYFTRLADIYGPIYHLRFGSQIAVVISSPSLARQILRDHDASFANHDFSAAAAVMSFRHSDIVWSPNGPTLRMLRRIFGSELFSPASLAAVYRFRRREIRRSICRLHASATAGQSVDVGEEVTATMLSVVTSMLWGGSETEEEEKESGVARKEFRELVTRISDILGQPNLSDFFPALRRFDLQGIKRKIGVLQKRLEGIFDEMIERKRRAGEKEGQDFLDFLLKVEKEGYDRKTPFTRDHVKALLMDVIIGGTETVSSTLEFTLAEMMNRPETITRAQDELHEVVGKNNVVEESHIHKLHYLSAVIREGLRLHPPLPLLVPHNPSSTCTVGGYSVPKGSKIFINISAIQRDPEVWKDAMDFKPERFMETAASKWDFTGNDFSYIPFGSGRRICAGIPLAERNFTYCLASMLHSFDWKLQEGSMLDLSEKFAIITKKAKPLVVIPIPRLSNPELYFP